MGEGKGGREEQRARTSEREKNPDIGRMNKQIRKKKVNLKKKKKKLF